MPTGWNVDCTYPGIGSQSKELRKETKAVFCLTDKVQGVMYALLLPYKRHIGPELSVLISGNKLLYCWLQPSNYASKQCMQVKADVLCVLVTVIHLKCFNVFLTYF